MKQAAGIKPMLIRGKKVKTQPRDDRSTSRKQSVNSLLALDLQNHS
jgi:hypothetical protein